MRILTIAAIIASFAISAQAANPAAVTVNAKVSARVSSAVSASVQALQTSGSTALMTLGLQGTVATRTLMNLSTLNDVATAAGKHEILQVAVDETLKRIASAKGRVEKDANVQIQGVSGVDYIAGQYAILQSIGRFAQINDPIQVVGKDGQTVKINNPSAYDKFVIDGMSNADERANVQAILALITGVELSVSVEGQGHVNGLKILTSFATEAGSSPNLQRLAQSSYDAIKIHFKNSGSAAAAAARSLARACGPQGSQG